MYTVRITKKDGSTSDIERLSHENRHIVDSWVDEVKTWQDVENAWRVRKNREPAEQEVKMHEKWNEAVDEYGRIETYKLIDAIWNGKPFKKIHHPAVELMDEPYAHKLRNGDPEQVRFLAKRLIQALLSLTHLGWPPAYSAPDEVFDYKVAKLADYFEPLLEASKK